MRLLAIPGIEMTLGHGSISQPRLDFNFIFAAMCDSVMRSTRSGVTSGQAEQEYSKSIYDAIIIGAGHNGLTAAAYLARAGLSTLVLERREIVGGCCVTEEIAPGCRASTTSYIASMLRPSVIRDLELGSHGLRMVASDPVLTVPFADGYSVRWWADREQTVE